MLYTEWKIEGREPLKLRLRARDCVEAEKRIGTNPINVIIEEAQKEHLPSVTHIMIILQCSMRAFEHGKTIEEVYDLYDAYMDSGGSIDDLLSLLLEVFKVSGFISDEEEDEAEEEEKNAAGAM